MKMKMVMFDNLNCMITFLSSFILLKKTKREEVILEADIQLKKFDFRNITQSDIPIPIQVHALLLHV